MGKSPKAPESPERRFRTFVILLISQLLAGNLTSDTDAFVRASWLFHPQARITYCEDRTAATQKTERPGAIPIS
jgi:hypothetical protein